MSPSLVYLMGSSTKGVLMKIGCRKMLTGFGSRPFPVDDSISSQQKNHGEALAYVALQKYWSHCASSLRGIWWLCGNFWLFPQKEL